MRAWRGRGGRKGAARYKRRTSRGGERREERGVKGAGPRSQGRRAVKMFLMRLIPSDTAGGSESVGSLRRTHAQTRVVYTSMALRRLKLRWKRSALVPMTVMITFAVKGRQSNFAKARFAPLKGARSCWNSCHYAARILRA